MPQPIPSSPLGTPSHSMLHNAHVNVKAFGATGDGSTDDTAAIQDAIEAAGATAALGGSAGAGEVFFPAGRYKVTGALDLNLDAFSNCGVWLVGPQAGTSQTGYSVPGVHIVGSVDGALLSRTTPNLAPFGLRNLFIYNTHATGTGVTIDGTDPTSGIHNCTIQGHTALSFGASGNTFSFTMTSVSFRSVGAFAGSRGIDNTEDHKTIICCDFSFFERGIYANGVGVNIIGCRLEACGFAVNWQGSPSGQIIGSTFEANDTAIRLGGAFGVLVAGNRVIGTNPTTTTVGHSIDAFSIGSSNAVTLVGNTVSGVHSNSSFTVDDASCDGITFIDCFANQAWVMASKVGVTIINCSPETDIVRAPVIATGSLPVAAAQENGRLVIEDAGAGDRNLILYAEGQRFRIDGGANV